MLSSCFPSDWCVSQTSPPCKWVPIAVLKMKFDQNQSSISLDFPLFSYLQLWRKSGFAFSHSESLTSALIVLRDLMWVNGPEDFYRFNIITFNQYFNISVVREESETEVFKQVFLQVIVLGCTKVVKTFDLLERLTDIWAERVRDSNDSEMIRRLRD